MLIRLFQDETFSENKEEKGTRSLGVSQNFPKYPLPFLVIMSNFKAVHGSRCMIGEYWYRDSTTTKQRITLYASCPTVSVPRDLG